jgi:hypothetical protein
VVYLYDSGTGKLQRHHVFLDLPVPVAYNFALAFSAAGRLRVAARPTAFYRETDSGEFIRRELDVDGLGQGIRDCAFSRDGSLLAAVGNINCKGALYDTATGDRRLAPRPRREN